MINKKSLNILVLLSDMPYSCTGYGIIKALSLSTLRYKLYCVSTSPYKAGLYMTENRAVSPSLIDNNYIDWLIDYCKKNEIHVLFPDDDDLTQISTQRKAFLEQAKTYVIASPQAMIDIASNKLLTCRWLKDKGFGFPPFAPANDIIKVEQLVANEGFPLFAKSILGRGSIGCCVINNATDLKEIQDKEGYIVQKLLGTNDEEFTAACFVDQSGKHRGTITMRRLIYHGASQYCDVVNDPVILNECKNIAIAIGARGTINIQLRMDRGRPICFEINPRFSSTSGIRAHFGFNDVEHTIRHFVLHEPAIDLPVIKEGTVLRYVEEIFINKIEKFRE